MSENQEVSGKCLCQKVTITIESFDPNLGACHCNMCRSWAAGPYLAVKATGKVDFTPKEDVGIYNSSEWAERGFCKNCGSSLFYRLKKDQSYFLSATLFDEKKLNFDHQVFIDEKPTYYDFANPTKNLTGKEIFEMVANEENSDI